MTSAIRVWQGMRDFVLPHDQRDELRDALGLGRGMGRIKVLLRLAEGPLTLRDIAEFTGVDAPYATLIVDRLEARELVERTPHPGDRRRKLVTLTPAGREAAALAAHITSQPPAGFTAAHRRRTRLPGIHAQAATGQPLPPELGNGVVVSRGVADQPLRQGEDPLRQSQ